MRFDIEKPACNKDVISELPVGTFRGMANPTSTNAVPTARRVGIRHARTRRRDMDVSTRESIRMGDALSGRERVTSTIETYLGDEQANYTISLG
jgi:hypothetical protein